MRPGCRHHRQNGSRLRFDVGRETPEKQSSANIKLEEVYGISTTLSLTMPSIEASDPFQHHGLTNIQ